MSKKTKAEITAIAEGKRTEEALKESEMRYRRLFETAQDGILILDADTGRITDVNPFLGDLLGYTPEEFVGKHLWEIGSFKDIEASRTAFAELQRTGYIRYEHLPLKSRAGHRIDVEFVSNVYVEDQRQVIQCNIRDITNRYRAEKALQGLERKQDQILRTIVDGIVVVNPEGEIEYANRSAERILDICQDTLVGKYYQSREWRQIDEDGQPYPLDQLPLAIALREQRDVEAMEHPLVAANGEWKWLSVNAAPLLDETGHLYGAVSSFRDISERKRKEHVLTFLAQCGTAPNENFFQSLARYLAENLNMDFVCIDQLEGDRQTARTVAIYFDGVFEDNVSYNLQDTPCGNVIGKTVCCFPTGVRQLFPQDDVLQDMLAESYVGVTLWSYTGQPIGLIAVIGRQRLVNTRLAKSLLQLVAVRAAAELERQQADAALRRARETADAANRAKSDFLAHMSHELRTPLNGILGYAQILKQDRTLTDTQHTRIEIIEQSGKHLLDLITEILDLAKIEARKVELHLTEVRVSEFLQGITAMIQVRADQKGIAFRYELAPDLPKIILADEQRLRQILLNLLNNAVKFTDQGTVSLRVFELHELNTHKLTNSPTHQLSFEVEDTGPGIAAEHLEDVFTPFGQVRESHHQGEGTGLGLTISQQLARLMGGVIFARSTLKQGSLFGLTLPFRELRQSAATQYAAHATPIGFKGTCKLLIVDDHADNRAMLHDMLQPLGFKIQESATGRAGVAHALAWHPAVILVDLMMPEMDGFEAVTRIRKSNIGDSPVIIAVSANVLTDTRRKSIAAGCDDFLPKPVQLDNILHVLRTHLTLDWIYAETSGHTGTSAAAPPLVIPPSPSLVAELLKFAQIGDVLAIRQQCGELIRQHPRLRPFASELNRLAQECELKNIKTFLAAYTSEQTP